MALDARVCGLYSLALASFTIYSTAIVFLFSVECAHDFMLKVYINSLYTPGNLKAKRKYNRIWSRPTNAHFYAFFVKY